MGRENAARAVWLIRWLALACLLSNSMAAHELISTHLTWMEHVSRIVQRRCLSCHRESGEAPFSLATYSQARPWAKAIKYQVLSRRMPPWDAVKGFGGFRRDMGLSQEEIAILSSWVEGGAPEGDPRFFRDEQTGGELLEEREPVVRRVLEANGQMALKRSVRAVGIRPLKIPEEGSLQVSARFPGGAVEPLLWLRGYRARWQRSYFFRDPIHLPPGTRFQVFPASGVYWQLLLGDVVSRERKNRGSLAEQALTQEENDLSGGPRRLQEGSDALVLRFVCPMDLEVRSRQAGTCPKCGMNLVTGLLDLSEYSVRYFLHPARLQPDESAGLRFEVRTPRTGRRTSRFVVVHERLFHLLVVRNDLEYFGHEHPELAADGTFRLNTRFPGEGTYRLLADFFPAGGTPQMVPLTVTTAGFTKGLEESQPRLVSDLSAKTGKNLAVALRTTPAMPVAALKTSLHFELSTSEGLEKYLGAWAHLLAASQDLVDLTHAHPAVADGGREIQFNMIFPRAGMYRLWIEVQRKGTVNTVSFTLPVKALE